MKGRLALGIVLVAGAVVALGWVLVWQRPARAQAEPQAAQAGASPQAPQQRR